MRSKKSPEQDSSPSWKLRNLMQCLCSPEQRVVNDRSPSVDPLDELKQKLETGNIEEAEALLRKTGPLNSVEARMLLGRYEYHKGNVEAALHVFEGIDISSLTPKIKLTLSRLVDHRKRRSQGVSTPPMSIQVVSLVFEAIYLKAKSLQSLGRFKEAAQSCQVILDLVESSLLDGFPGKFGADFKLREILIEAFELLPALWQLADCPSDAISSYRKVLSHRWNLNAESTARIQKAFAIYLLYGGYEAESPNLSSQMNASFVPKNNLEEAILLLKLLCRKATCGVIEWDSSILDHLSYAISMSNQPLDLAHVIEALPPGIITSKELYHSLALCYFADGDNLAALNLLSKLLHPSNDPNHIPSLVLASKICSGIPNLAEDGIAYARRALQLEGDECPRSTSTATFLLGMSLSEYARSAIAGNDRIRRQSEGIRTLEDAGNMTNFTDPEVVYYLSVLYAEERKLDTALYYAKRFLRLEGGADRKGWLLVGRILSGQKQFVEAEAVIDAALGQTGRWDQVELIRTKAKIQIAQGHLKKGVETYSQLLGVLLAKRRSNEYVGDHCQKLEMLTWLDLASIYIGLSRWNDAHVCVSKARVIGPYCAATWQAVGSLHEAKDQLKEALSAYNTALSIDPTHVPSLISSALLLKRLTTKPDAVIRSYLMNALKFDRTNHIAWHNLGLLYKDDDDDDSSLSEAIECFKAAAFLEETAPVEPFR